LLKQDKLAGSTLLVLCNKQDIEGALSLKQISEALELDSITTKHWMIMPCSAKNSNINKVDIEIKENKDKDKIEEENKEDYSKGVENKFKWILDDVNSRIFMLQ